VDPAAKPAIVFVSPGGLAERGGIGRSLTSLARAWGGRGAELPLAFVDSHGSGGRFAWPFRWTAALARIARDARRGRIALLHVNMATRGSALRKAVIVRLGARLGVPVVVQLHGNDTEDFFGALPGFAARALTRSLARADRVIVLGEAGRRIAVEVLGVRPARLRVLPNAVRLPEGPAPARAGDGCRLLFLGRLDASKGFPELLAALAAPSVAALDWTARAAGVGPVRRWRARAAALGLAPRLRIEPWQPEPTVRGWLAESDLLVLPSRREGLPLALLEAMAFGCAVIATPVGCVPEVVEPDRSGLLVPPGDADALAAALARAIGDPALRARLGAAARTTVRERHAIEGYCEKLAALYREVLAERGRG
jgi:glycosyltransferase involved in cell wall biosynthesis